MSVSAGVEIGFSGDADSDIDGVVTTSKSMRSSVSSESARCSSLPVTGGGVVDEANGADGGVTSLIDCLASFGSE